MEAVMVVPEKLDLLAAQALDAAPPPRLSPIDISRRAETRRLRGMALRASVSLVVVVMAVAVGWSLQRSGDEQIQVATLQQTTINDVMLDDIGIWPSGDGAPSPTALGEDFAAGVLGWQNATVTTDPSRAGDPTWLTIQDPTTGARLRALSVPTIDTGHWRFIQIGSELTLEPGDTGLRVRVSASPKFDRIVAYASTNTGTRSFQVSADGTSTSIELTGISDLNELRSILVLYRSANGHVLDAGGGVIAINPPAIEPSPQP